MLLSKDAAKIIMEALYGARLVRFEVLWPICNSARQFMKWTRACDKRLHRLMCYIHHTEDHSLESCVGDDAQNCHPVLFSDADFAGDMQTAKSTSGCYLAIVGPNIRPRHSFVQEANLCLTLLDGERDSRGRARHTD